ncbi:MAG: DNA cytosine methyltransferase [Campylobacterota bacterium]|nr:DNA cytosine methyltransferase [Campylobacterota bacterium]
MKKKTLLQRITTKRINHHNLVRERKLRIQSEFKVPNSKQKIKEKIKEVRKKLTVMSVFNGIGAFSESLKQLGIDYEINMICEIDAAANKTYYTNNNYDVKKHTNDINVLLDNVEENLDLDILVMTPECQQYSSQGSRKGFDSVSGNLTKVAIELFQKIQPKVLILENVFSLTHHNKYIHTYKRKNGTTFETFRKLSKKEFKKTDLKYIGKHENNLKSKINKDFKNTIGQTLLTVEELFLSENGKDYNFYWKKMSPKYYGAPQNRDRFILVAIRKNIDNGFKFPQHKELEFTVADILEKNKSKIDNSLYFTQNKVFTKSIKPKIKKNLHYAGKFYQISFDTDKRVLHPYIAAAILTGNSNKYMINGVIRKLTPSENMRIMGFNPNFKFAGTEAETNKQIGNSVSPYIYKPVIEQVLKYVDFGNVDIEKKEVSQPTKKSNRGRKPKKVVINDNHISIIKNVCNFPDLNYVNAKEEIGKQYIQHLKNGGTITLTVNKYKNVENKKNKKIEKKVLVQIKGLEMLKSRNSTQMRFKIIGSKDAVETIGERDVLIVRPGGKGKFKKQFHYTLNEMKMLDKKLPIVIDSFFGGGGITLKNIEKLHFKRYVINDLEPLIYKTMLAIQKDYKKVLENYQQTNQNYYDLISDELRNYKKDKNCKTRIDPKLQEIRDKDRRYRDYYKSIGKKLNNHKNMDIYEVAGLFLMFNNKSTNGILDYNNDGSIDLTNCNNETTLKDKTHMIKHWSFLLNFYNVEIYNKDVFELLNDPTIPKNGLVFSDSPYIPKKKDLKVINYNMDNSIKFQYKLKETLSNFENVIYCNENCEFLYELGLNKGFDNYITFGRKNNLGQKNSKDKNTSEINEFLGFWSNKSIQNIQTPINTTTYQPILKSVA